MSDHLHRRASRLAIGALVLLLAACGVDPDDLASGEPSATTTGISEEQNVQLAAELQAEFASTLQGVTDVEVIYHDRLTLPATLSIIADVADADQALTGSQDAVLPSLPVFQDPEQSLAPVAAQIAQAAWLSQVDPMRSLSIELQDRATPQDGQSFDLGVADSDVAAAFDEAFGQRPG